MTQGAARVQGLDVEAAACLLEDLGRKVEYADEKLEPAYAGAFVARAHLRFAAGWALDDVVSDLWYAGRCYGIDPALHLARHQYEQLLTRRIVPVECGILGGQVDLCKRIAAAYGLPLVTALGGMARVELAAELKTISPALTGKPISHPQHLLGLVAGVYAAALGSAARGYADEVVVALGVIDKVTFRGELSETQKMVLQRYTGLCEAMAVLVGKSRGKLPEILGNAIAVYEKYMSSQLSEAWRCPTAPVRYMDTGVLAVLGLVLLSDFDMGTFPAAGETRQTVLAYSDVFDAMRQGRAEERVAEIDTATLLEAGRKQLDT